MQPYTLTRDQVRELDRRAIEEYGIPGPVLIENAGRGAAELVIALGVHGPVLICCGKGNNGGDGLVMARHLDRHGIPTRVLLFARPEELSADAATNLHILQRARFSWLTIVDSRDAEESRGLPPPLAGNLRSCEWVVDALFGTGLSGPVRAPLDAVISAINASACRVFAVDIPSGLDCDTGKPLGAAIRAHHTATFVAEKQGFVSADAKPCTGRVHVVDIGVPRELLTHFNAG